MGLIHVVSPEYGNELHPSGAEGAAEKQKMDGELGENIPRRLKPAVILLGLAARLKSCPFKTWLSLSFSAASEARIDLVAFAARLKRLRKKGEQGEKRGFRSLAGAKALSHFAAVSARLKSCPVTKQEQSRVYPQPVKSCPVTKQVQMGVFSAACRVMTYYKAGTRPEWRTWIKGAICALLFVVAVSGLGLAQEKNQLRFCLGAQPRTFNPLLVADEASETIRYLTGGVLVRLNRASQQLEPELATAWKVNHAGSGITFTLREGVRFSDGSPFTAEDVAYTVEQLMDPALHSPTGDSFRTGEGKVTTRIEGRYRITIVFPAPVVGLDKLFDQVAILSATSKQKEMAVLGPYYVAENKSGSYLLLRRNPNYWKHDAAGRALPYIDSVRLDIQQNRDMELLRLERGEIDMINSLNGESFDRLKTAAPQLAHDAGVSLDSEEMWFNQVSSAPLPDYKKAWFASTHFRRAVSSAIRRDDLARVVFRGHAQPAVSWISPANRFWFNQRLRPHAYDAKGALDLLARDGFRLEKGVLRDGGGHAVEFSIITNAGNKDRERMAAMIQQDLGVIGIRLNVVTLDFPSLIERITRTFNYEACLLGFVNDELDPNAQMNVWLSSGETHQWNPAQKTPATAWEAEIDRLMRLQASTLDMNKRKQAVDRVQQIVWEQEPFIYLVNKNALSAVSTSVHRAQPVALRPQVFWNIDELTLGSEVARNR